MVDNACDNAIILNGGANLSYPEKQDLSATWKSIISEASVILLQREIPEHVNLAVARYAKSVKERSIIVVLDMGGRDEAISKELVDLCDIVSPNETEKRRIFESVGVDGEVEAEREDSFVRKCRLGQKLLLK